MYGCYYNISVVCSGLSLWPFRKVAGNFQFGFWPRHFNVPKLECRPRGYLLSYLLFRWVMTVPSPGPYLHVSIRGTYYKAPLLRIDLFLKTVFIILKNLVFFICLQFREDANMIFSNYLYYHLNMLAKCSRLF